MKKLIIIAAVMAVTVGSLFAQGRVSLGTAGNAAINVKLVWPSSVPAGVTTPPGFVANGTVATGSGFVADLFWSLTPGKTTFAELTDGRSGTTANVSSGYFIGGNRTVTGWSAGAISAGIGIWNTSSGATLAEAMAKPGGMWAVTAVAGVTPTTGTTAAPYLPLGGTAANPILLPVIINPVPEPSTMAVAGLGLASLLIFRRRK